MTTEPSPSKSVHIGTAAIVGLILVVLAFIYEDLRSSPDRIFATVAGGVGIYAALFAIIELLRLKSVSAVVSNSVRRIESDMRRMSSIRDYQDCQSAVDRLSIIIESGEETPFSIVRDLVKKYSYCFPAEMQDAESEHRRNRSELVMFCDATTKTQRKAATQRLRGPLLSITSQLSVSTATSIHQN